MGHKIILITSHLMRNFSLRKDSLFSMNAYLEDSNYFERYNKEAETTAGPIKLSETLDHFLQTLGIRVEPTKSINAPNVNDAADHARAKPVESEHNIKKSKHYKEISKEIPEENAEVLLRRLSKGAKVEKKRPTKVDGKKKINKKALSAAAEASSPRGPTVICRYFMEGLCAKGAECPFSHAAIPRKTVEQVKAANETCKFFVLGSCLKGDACLFSHDLSRVPCKFFHLWRECSAGSACRFSHLPVDADTRNRMLQEANKKE